MKHLKKTLTAFTIVAAIAASGVVYGCGSDDSSDSGEIQIVTVARGPLMTTISSFGSISMPEQAELTFGAGGGSVSDLFTVSEVNVEFGDSVMEGDFLARVDTDSLERAVKQEEADLRTAQINLEEASSEASLLGAQAAVLNAEASLASAEKALEEAQSYSLAEAKTDLESARRSLATALKTAEINITNAQDTADDAYTAYVAFLLENSVRLEYSAALREQRDDLLWAYEAGLHNLRIAEDNAATSIANAQNAVTAADNDLADVPIEIQQQEATVAQARAALIQAEADLSYIEAGYDIELLQIEVDNAQVALDNALDQLEAATIVAPFDGVVASVNASVGDDVTANEVIIHLVNTSVVEVDAAVDEIDVAQVEPGLRAIITVDALPNAMLMGIVAAVSPVGTSQSGVVTYAIAIEVLNASQVEVREAMTVTIDIVIMQAENVLLVPTQAIQRSGAKQVVEVVTAAGETEERVVRTGATNGMQTEIVTGLEEGEQVAIHASSNLSDMMQQFRPGGGMFRGGGGMPPGMQPPH